MVGGLDFKTAMTELERHPDHLRIKKLLWTILYQYWENDTNRLRAVTIQYLVEELQKYYPHLEDLAAALYGLVDTINKKTEYSRVANLLIQYLTSGYSVTRIQPPRNLAQPVIDGKNKAFEELAEAIAQHEQTTYIKRMLQLLCSSHLDKSPQQLQKKDLISLVKELSHLAADLDELQILLLDAVKSVDQKKEYIWAADALSELMWTLYEGEDETVVNPAVESFVLSPAQANPIPSSPPKTAPPPEIAPKTPTERRSPRPVDRKEQLWTVRMDLINRTNPLRAKILLFSALHGPFAFSTQHWLELKTKTLGHMLTELQEKYRDLKKMEEHLLKTAHNLQDTNENIRTARAIMQGMRSLQQPPKQ
jgi:hypothetical protein